jgi:hypothetical protein
MNQNKRAGQMDLAREITEIHGAADAADADLRILRDLEMGWVAGGDGEPVWPY